jgi:hypothetical protein
MNKQMIASQSMTYATRRLQAGDGFEASRRDAELLKRLGRATEAPADPLDHDRDGKKGGSTPAKKSDELTALRALYQDRFGKRAFHGWDAKALTEKLAEAKD